MQVQGSIQQSDVLRKTIEDALDNEQGKLKYCLKLEVKLLKKDEKELVLWPVILLVVMIWLVCTI